MAEMNPKQALRAATERAQRLLTNDLNAIPEDKQNASPGGAARPPLHIVAECATVNGFIAQALRGETPQRPDPEQRDAHLRSFDTAQKALAYLEQETQNLLSAIDALDETTLGDVSMGPVGRPMSRFELASLPAGHMMYHDGQPTYIQTLYGDRENHWG